MPVEFNIFLVAWFWTHFDPIQERLHEWACYWKEHGFLTTSLESIYEIVTCFYCTCFWLGLVCTMDPMTAIVLGFSAYTYKKLIERC